MSTPASHAGDIKTFLSCLCRRLASTSSGMSRGFLCPKSDHADPCMPCHLGISEYQITGYQISSTSLPGRLVYPTKGLSPMVTCWGNLGDVMVFWQLWFLKPRLQVASVDSVAQCMSGLDISKILYLPTYRIMYFLDLLVYSIERNCSKPLASLVVLLYMPQAIRPWDISSHAWNWHQMSTKFISKDGIY